MIPLAIVIVGTAVLVAIKHARRPRRRRYDGWMRE